MTFDRQAYGKALTFVMDLHKGQSRGNGDPYLLHLLRVSTTVLSLDMQPEYMVLRDKMGIAALLHDAIEDAESNGADPKFVADYIDATFGTFVLGIVKELTQDGSLPTAERRAKMVEHCGFMSQHAQIIKLADRLDNCREMKGMSNKFIARYLDETPRMLAQMKGACPRLEQQIWQTITPLIQQQNAEKVTVVLPSKQG